MTTTLEQMLALIPARITYNDVDYDLNMHKRTAGGRDYYSCVYNEAYKFPGINNIKHTVSQESMAEAVWEMLCWLEKYAFIDPIQEQR